MAHDTTNPFIRLKEPPPMRIQGFKPIPYSKNGNYIFMTIADSNSFNRSLLCKYDLDKQMIADDYQIPYQTSCIE